MQICFSPCPNDTFIFYAWVNQCLPHTPRLDVTYADINITNRLAMNNTGPDIMKISCAALPFIHPEYTLVPCGGALGRGCGPLLLAKNDSIYLRDISALIGKVVAIPSERSTAYLLLKLWAKKHLPEGITVSVLPFHEIMIAVRDGMVDAGLVIHEARFTYPSYGLASLVDLGEWWEKETTLPIPLGAIIARRSLDIKLIIQLIQASLSYAWDNPNDSLEYIKKHAQEMDTNVIQEHIHLYVNSFSYDLGPIGRSAITTLLCQASSLGLIPAYTL